jgi:tetratricopeptide (TPR) repeat protein
MKYFVLSSEQGDSQAPYLLALLYIEGKRIPPDPKEGLVWLQLAAERNNEKARKLLASMNQKENAQALKQTYDRAVALLDQGKNAQAEGLLSGILDQSSQQVDVFSMLGIAQSKQGKYTESIETLTKANALFPNNPKVIGLLAISYSNSGDYETAMNYFEQSLSLDPHNKVVRQERDKAAFHSSKYSNAELNQMFASGQKYLSEGNPAAAEKVFKELLRIKTDDADFYVFTGISMSMQGNHKGAISVFEAGNTILPGNVEILANLGYAQSLLGNNAKAISYYREVLAIDPNHQRTLSNLQKATLDLENQ